MVAGQVTFFLKVVGRLFVPDKSHFQASVLSGPVQSLSFFFDHLNLLPGNGTTARLRFCSLLGAESKPTRPTDANNLLIKYEQKQQVHLQEVQVTGFPPLKYHLMVMTARQTKARGPHMAQ